MASTIRGLLLILVPIFFVGTAAADPPQQKARLVPVTFLRDSVGTVDDTVIHLLSGSTWLAGENASELIASDVVIILTSSKGGILYHDGDQIPVTYLGAAVVTERGRYGQVVQSMGDGAVLRLNDGSLWEISEYDRFDTGWWLPPYPVLVTGGGLYLVNLKKGKRVWAKQIQ